MKDDNKRTNVDHGRSITTETVRRIVGVAPTKLLLLFDFLLSVEASLVRGTTLTPHNRQRELPLLLPSFLVMSLKADPLSHLDEESIRQVLWFVGCCYGNDGAALGRTKEPPKGTSVVNAVKLYYTVAPVSKSWKYFVDKNIARLVEGTEVDFNSLERNVVSNAVSWLLRHQAGISTIKSYALKSPLTSLIARGDSKNLSEASFRIDGLSQNSVNVWHAIADHCPNVALCMLQSTLHNGSHKT